LNKYRDLQKHFDQGILRFAVNQEYVVENIDLNEDDEIAVFPPVSGG
jgi:molybdopterin converting factor small subunit